MLPKHLCPFVAAFVILAGCAEDPAVQSPDPELRFDTSMYEIASGGEKNYYCYTFRLPADKETVIQEIAPIYGKATHHLGIYYTLVPEPDGAFDCAELVRETWVPLYGGGVESGSLTLPDDAAFRLNKNQQILVQLHLLNAGAETVKDKATIVFKTTDRKDLISAGMYGMDNRDINILPNTSNVMHAMSCPPVGKEMNVFAVFGHMHERGKAIELSRGNSAGTDILYRSDVWDFNNQPTTPVQLKLLTTDTLHLRCWHDNPTSMAMAYGESTFDEMCSFAFYYTPYDSLDGCVKTPP